MHTVGLVRGWKAAPISQNGGADFGDGKRRHFFKMAGLILGTENVPTVAKWRD